MAGSSTSRRSRTTLRTHNARLAISILENGLKGGRLAAAQRAAIAVLRAPEPVPETVSFVRFVTPSPKALEKANRYEKAAADCLRRG